MAEAPGAPSGDTFTTPGWLRNGHLQTLWAPLLRRVTPPPRRRERLELPDGDFVICDWTTAPGAAPDTPWVVLLHGLAGCTDSSYIVGMQQTLLHRGWHSVVLNFRGATGEPNRRARSYHSGDTGDFAVLLEVLRDRHPTAPLAAVGYSLGGNVLLKWLGEQGHAAGLEAACAVSVPLHLGRCASRLDRGLSRLYRDYLLRRLKRGLITKRTALVRAGAQDELKCFDTLGDWRRARSFWEFDSRVIAPLHGFRDAADYYADASSARYLGGIRVPTLLVQARDDPFMTPDVIPSREAVPPSLTLCISDGGGHVGFVCGTPWRPDYWLERRLSGFLAARLVTLPMAPA